MKKKRENIKKLECYLKKLNRKNNIKENGKQFNKEQEHKIKI